MVWQQELDMEGRILAGRYRLIDQLGGGGMGSVWRAEHLTLGTPIAIKLMESSIARAPEALARFRREAQSAAELRSVHVVQIIDYGVDSETPFIAMELLEGESLASRLRTVRRLTPEHTARILTQVVIALSKAHAAGIVHRDLKPENIFLLSEGGEDFAKVLDFGIAKKVNVLESTTGVKTGTGTLLGSPFYMSPEQAKGDSSVDQRADIWSLGVIAFECITGERPFVRDTLGALIGAICYEAIPVPSTRFSVPAGFDEWFAQAASRDPAARFASADVAIAELRRVCGLDQQTAPSAPPHGQSELPRANTVALPGAEAELSHTAVPATVTIAGRRLIGGRRLWMAIGASLALCGLGFGAAHLRKANGVTPVSSSFATDLPELKRPEPSREASVFSATPILPVELEKTTLSSSVAPNLEEPPAPQAPASVTPPSVGARKTDRKPSNLGIRPPSLGKRKDQERRERLGLPDPSR